MKHAPTTSHNAQRTTTKPIERKSNLKQSKPGKPYLYKLQVCLGGNNSNKNCCLATILEVWTRVSIPIVNPLAAQVSPSFIHRYGSTSLRRKGILSAFARRLQTFGRRSLPSLATYKSEIFNQPIE